MKRVALLAIALLVIAASCSYAKKVERTVSYNMPDGTLKIISFNIRLSANKVDGRNAWKYRKDATLEMIQKETPSAFGLQEAMPDQVKYISDAFPQYDYVGVGRDDGKKSGEFMAIFYLKDKFELLDSGTYWLSETPDVVSRGWDAQCNRTLTWVKLKEISTGKVFFYYNTHLDHIGEKAREESVKLIVDIIKKNVPEGMPVIFGGDLNSSIDSPIFNPLLDMNMKSVRETAPETDHKGTFNAFGTAPSNIILDHIFIRDIEPISYRTLVENYGAPYISDHYPIEVVLKLK